MNESMLLKIGERVNIHQVNYFQSFKCQQSFLKRFVLVTDGLHLSAEAYTDENRNIKDVIGVDENLPFPLVLAISSLVLISGN